MKGPSTHATPTSPEAAMSVVVRAVCDALRVSRATRYRHLARARRHDGGA